MTDTNTQSGAEQTSWGILALYGLGHTLGVAVTAAAMFLLAIPMGSVLPFLGEIASSDALIEMSMAEAGIHVLLAAVLWSLLVVAFQRLSKTKDVKVVKMEAGTVLTETIIVLPVMLLIIFGLAQVATNNIAGMLANVAAYQGARSAWVWAPEVNEGRAASGTIENSDVTERARIAAALVMTPVAPGEYRQASTSRSEEFKNVRLAMFMGQFKVGGGMSSLGEAYVTGKVGSAIGNSQDLRMSKALDESDFRDRVIFKLTHAYDAVELHEVNVDDSTKEVEFSLEYLHFQGYPLVGLMFGERLYTHQAPGGRPGYYLRIKRKVRLPMRTCDTQWSTTKHCPPNPNVP